MAAASFNCDTITIGGTNSGKNEGSDKHWND